MKKKKNVKLTKLEAECFPWRAFWVLNNNFLKYVGCYRPQKMKSMTQEASKLFSLIYVFPKPNQTKTPT